MKTTKDLIAEARELAENVSPKTWTLLGGTFEDYHFLCRSRTLVPELCDALERAQRDSDRLEAAQRWVPVGEPPERGAAVLVYAPAEFTLTSVYMDYFDQSGKFTRYARRATHWRPLPEPPEQKGDWLT